MLEELRDYFKKCDENFTCNLLEIVEAMMRCSSCNSSKIVMELQKLRGYDFKTSDMFLYRFLRDQNFQIDDSLWRCHINIIFEMLRKKKVIDEKKPIYINIDYTSDEEDFLILCASIQSGGYSLPIYFTMRRYPVKKNMIDQKKMEKAFLKGLKHCLSVRYDYVIVADRGFGNARFIELCEDAGFEHVIRFQPSMKVLCGCKEGIIENIIQDDGIYEIYGVKWKKKLTLYRIGKEEKTWYILSDIKGLSLENIQEIYEQRFEIEKNFQNLKSAGFDIEKSRIRKYDRFKRLVFLSCFAYGLMTLMGDFIDKKVKSFKKN